MGILRKIWLSCVSEVVWRHPRRPAQLLAEFSQAERGSCYDMLAAAELTTRRDLRRKYLEHALDEARHARIFRRRALALGIDKEYAALLDVGHISEQGIVGGETLFERLGEMDFLAFVHIAEKRALEQFGVYQERKLPDPETQMVLDFISKDEVFHMTYSLAALDLYKELGMTKELNRALRQVGTRRFKEGWLRGARKIGTVVSRFWLGVMYFSLVAPFRLLSKEEPIGWKQRPYDCSLARASAQY